MSTSTSSCQGWTNELTRVHVGCVKGTKVKSLEVTIAGATVVVRGMCSACQKLHERAEAEAREHRMMDEMARRSDAGSRLAGFSLETYPRTGAGSAAFDVGMNWLRGFQEGSRANLYLHGNAGRGKSGLAWSLARRVVEDAVRADPDLERVPAVFVNFRLLLARIKDGFGQRERGETVTRYFGIRLLVLDDLGSERPSEFNRDELLNLIDTRYERQLPTVFTSNLDLAQIGRRLSDPHDPDMIDGLRFVSRITEDMVVHELGGRDLRRGSK